MSAVRFLEARPLSEGPAAVVIQGAPYDGGVSYRAGARRAPYDVRVASDSIESYSHRFARDLIDIDLADAGDIPLGEISADAAMDRISSATSALAAMGAVVLTFGGDHSVSIGTSRGLRTVHPDLVHIVFDAHLDMRPSYDGSDLSHACGTRHMAMAAPTCVLGVRSGSREEYADADKMLTAWTEDLVVPGAMREAMRGAPVFVSVDMDVLDPSILPGTGNPEPGGPTYKELREAMLALRGARIVGIDFVEVSPAIDTSGLSPIVAAELARDCILGLIAST
ncbi:MAG TPA: agmatinase [Actinomycetota bacterium]|nr:agmatinase [Actinomycetota bacterium]